MNVEKRLIELRDLVQHDVGNRGLASDPNDNLLTACPDDFAAACHSIAESSHPVVGIVTGFPIPAAEPPSDETDGPLGALFLARTLTPLGVRVRLLADGTAVSALRAGLRTCKLTDAVVLEDLSLPDARCLLRPMTHLIALERVGPSHTPDSLRNHSATTEDDRTRFRAEVPSHEHNRCHTMRGVDVTERIAPAHRLFEEAVSAQPPIVTIGIGDGGNEIGMGKIRWDTIRRNIPRGGLIACRVPTDYLIVAGISNWGAYALAAGVALLLGKPLVAELQDVEREREILRVMIEQGPLVDGVSAKPMLSVDGLPFEEYVTPLREMASIS